MTDKMINGILFIIAGLGPIAVYLGLGETGILDKGHTEKIAAYLLLTIPLAFMMTRNVERNTFIDAGPLWQHTDYVLTKDDGAPIAPDHLSRAFRRIGREAGLPPMARSRVFAVHTPRRC
jgi:hypothetical protein